MKNYFYEQGGRSVGPVEPEEIFSLFEKEEISGDTLVWSEGMSTWHPFKEHFSREYERLYGKDENEELFLQDDLVVGNDEGSIAVGQGGRAEDNIVLAPLVPRIIAFVLDNIFLIPANLVAVYLFLGQLPSPEIFANSEDAERMMQEVFGVITPIFLLYQTVMVAKYRATFGKMMMKIEVVDQEGKTLHWVNALWRGIGHVLSGMFFYLGFVSILFTKKKLALHDFLARSVVVSNRKDDL